MAKGLYLGIGLNSVNPKYYGGWSGRLRACEHDIKDMSSIVSKYGFYVQQLLTKEATRANVKRWIREAASIMEAEDILIVNYSGHGGQIPDRNGDEEDSLDETWCLYDGQLIDDELFSLLHTLAEGSRIIVISDSCHSGTMLKNRYRPRYLSRLLDTEPPEYLVRAMPLDVQEEAFLAMQGEYENISLKRPVLRALIDQRREKNHNRLMLMSGCQDNQYSQDGRRNGLFTGTLKKVCNNGTFKGSYKEFYTKILRSMPPDQTPNMMLIGDTDNSFLNERIFTI
jgi:hypothetical protein